MKKFNHNTIKGFGAGLLAAAVIAGSGLPAQALSAFKQINVSMGGISLYVDGKLQVPTDVNGNEVEPLIYAGTTYLPVRALTGMLTDKPVEWDPNTESVYIGLKPGAGKVVRADELTPYDSSSALAYTGKDAQFTLLNETQTPFNLYRSGRTVKLDGMYTELNGYMSNVALDTETALDFDGLFEGEINHYVDCIRGRAGRCISPAEDGITLMKILDGIYESAATGHEVLLK